MKDWFKTAVFYEIYPQSFMDSNGDGVGDLQGIISKLDYVKDLGADAIWLNPIFDSPFKDAGYDVRDYKKVAERYGTNDDAKQLFEEAHQKGLRILLDLVPGHTSEQHEWFKLSGAENPEDRGGMSDRYVWSKTWFGGMWPRPYIGGEMPRNGTYLINFFKSQPALNYGFGEIDAPWQQRYDSEGAIATRDAMVDVCKFWLSMGCDGFRVDMADSLVKNDTPEKKYTCETWRYILGKVRADFPEAVFVSEWSWAKGSLCDAGFDMDFWLDHAGGGYNSLLRDYERGGVPADKVNPFEGEAEPGAEDKSFFKTGSGGDPMRFVNEFNERMESVIESEGAMAYISCNHDTPRAARTLSEKECLIAYATLFSLPGVPFIYYGDEIGMTYLEGLSTVEGGYTRTGSRSPMQWDSSDNCGFSTADAKDLYIPQDDSENAPTVAMQTAAPYSMLNTLKNYIALRKSEPSLAADSPVQITFAREGIQVLSFNRGNDLTVTANMSLDNFIREERLEVIFSLGDVKSEEGKITFAPGSFAICRIKE